jgi:hypothetical protein
MTRHQVLLRHKVRQWAAVSDGLFWAMPAATPAATPRMVRWAELAAAPAGEWKVLAARRKPAARALEKLLRVTSLPLLVHPAWIAQFTA